VDKACGSHHCRKQDNFNVAKMAGGPFKPDFGLSGAVAPLDTIPPLVRLSAIIKSDSISTARRDVTFISRLLGGNHLHFTFPTESTLPISPAPLTTIFHSFIFPL
jgi:hypothetical protein